MASEIYVSETEENASKYVCYRVKIRWAEFLVTKIKESKQY